MRKTQVNAWTEGEDALILKLKNKGLRYKDIAEVIPNRTQDSIRARYFNLVHENNNSWLSGEVIGVLDIEASDLNAVRGFMLSWAIAYADGTVKSACITKKEILSGQFDKRLVRELIEELKKIDTVIGYYSKRYDIPFVRSRAMFWGIDFPTVGSVKHIDLYDAVKHKLALPRNTLDMATHFLGIEGKNHLDLQTWNKAAYGDAESLAEVLYHNVEDVKISLQLYNRLISVVKFTKGAL